MIRYSKLGYVELNVTDLERALAFYTGIVGLEDAGRGADGGVRLRCTDEPYAVVLHQAAAPGFKRVGWMLEDERQFDILRRRLREHGVAHEEVPAEECAARQIGRACRMVEPNTEATIELYRPRPDMPRRAFVPTLAKIQRLGHVVFSTPRYHDAIAFFRDVLNFYESDSIGEGISFFRAWPNPYHHGLGIGRGAHNQFHHLNFMVTEIDDVGRGFNRLRTENVPVVFGPGRHIASGSVFLYFLDPDGLTLEYSYGMEEFPEVDARTPRKLPPVPESIDSWGAQRDPRMSSIGEIERYRITQRAS
jgi:2,3-dihydroxy-p-cumate/2,3-dihydroxybenzoate 3,4-dioxygenase